MRPFQSDNNDISGVPPTNWSRFSCYCQLSGDSSSDASRLYKVIGSTQLARPNEVGDGSQQHTNPATGGTFYNETQTSFYSDLPAEGQWLTYTNWSVPTAVQSGDFTALSDGIIVGSNGTYKCTAHMYVLARNYSSVGATEPATVPNLARLDVAAQLCVNASTPSTALALMHEGGRSGRFGPVAHCGTANRSTFIAYQSCHASSSISCLKALNKNDRVGLQFARTSDDNGAAYDFIGNGCYTFLSIERV